MDVGRAPDESRRLRCQVRGRSVHRSPGDGHAGGPHRAGRPTICREVATTCQGSAAPVIPTCPGDARSDRVGRAHDVRRWLHLGRGPPTDRVRRRWRCFSIRPMSSSSGESRGDGPGDGLRSLPRRQSASRPDVRVGAEGGHSGPWPAISSRLRASRSWPAAGGQRNGSGGWARRRRAGAYHDDRSSERLLSASSVCLTWPEGGRSGTNRADRVKPIRPLRHRIGERLGRDLAAGIGQSLQHCGRLFCREVRRP